MTDREYPLEPLLSGARGAAAVVAGYFSATVLGICLGAWSAGWDVHRGEDFVYYFLGYYLGLRKLAGLLSFMGLGFTTYLYYKLDFLKWEFVNAIALLWMVYIYVALGAGKLFPQPSIQHHVPGWRIVASVTGIVVIYVLGRVAFWPGRMQARRSS